MSTILSGAAVPKPRHNKAGMSELHQRLTEVADSSAVAAQRREMSAPDIFTVSRIPVSHPSLRRCLRPPVPVPVPTRDHLASLHTPVLRRRLSSLCLACFWMSTIQSPLAVLCVTVADGGDRMALSVILLTRLLPSPLPLFPCPLLGVVCHVSVHSSSLLWDHHAGLALSSCSALGRAGLGWQ